MLLAQSQPCLAAGASRGPGKQTSDHACRFCATPRLSSESIAAAFWENAGARSRGVFAVRYRFQRSGLRRPGDGARFRGGLQSWRRTSCVLMANREGAAVQPLTTENSSMASSQNDQREAHLVAPPENQYASTVALPPTLPQTLRIAHLSVVDQAFLLLGFIAFTASFALFALIVTAIPTLHAMRRAAVSVEKLADIAREELPGTMAAIRLSGMEISDLTLELNDLSQEISDGVRSSARAVQAAEVGIRRIGAVAASQTFAILQGTANVPVQVVRPAVVSAAATTLHAVSQAQKLVLSLASSSYPHISGWLGQRGSPGKQQKPVGKASSTATLTELLAGEETPAASLLTGSPQLSLFDGTHGDQGQVIRVPSPASDN